MFASRGLDETINLRAVVVWSLGSVPAYWLTVPLSPVSRAVDSSNSAYFGNRPSLQVLAAGAKDHDQP
jgi:hypothetical protein